MSKYVKQARDFLESCNATMDIIYLGTEVNKDWDEKRERDTYMVNIRTPKGNMQVKFWDSINNTIKNSDAYRTNRLRIKPTVYDILSCLQKYDVGDIEDFANVFQVCYRKGGNIKETIRNTYEIINDKMGIRQIR